MGKRGSTVQAFLTLLVAVAVAFFTYLKWWLDRAAHRREMFVKRFAVYQAAAQFLSESLGSLRTTSEQQIAFIDGTQPATFLFGLASAEIAAYLKKLWDMSADYQKFEALVAQQGPGAERDNTVAAKKQCSDWLYAQSNGGMVEKFKDHLMTHDTPPWLDKLGARLHGQ